MGGARPSYTAAISAAAAADSVWQAWSGSSSPPAAENSAGWGGESWGGQGKGKGKAPAVEEDWWKGKGPC